MQARKALPISAAAALIGLILSSTVFSSGSATAQEEDTGTQEESTAASGDRWLEILQPLVDNGTISAEQAAAVASHLSQNAPGRRGHFVGRAPGLAGFAAAAEILGIEASDLREALGDGFTLAEVAEANGIEAQALIDGLLAALEEKLDEAVASGKVTEDRAAEILEHAPERIENLVNSEVHLRRGFWFTPGERLGA